MARNAEGPRPGHHYVCAWLTTPDFERVRRLAEASGQTMSEFVRGALGTVLDEHGEARLAEVQRRGRPRLRIAKAEMRGAHA